MYCCVTLYPGLSIQNNHNLATGVPRAGARSTTFLLLQIALRRDQQLEGVDEREAPARLHGDVCSALAAIHGNGTESDSGRLAGTKSKVR
jgi:hypothetical protein